MADPSRISREGSVLVRRLGVEDAATVARLLGGRRLFVPEYVGVPPNGGRNGFARIEALVGRPIAIKLILHFGGTRLYVPMAGTPRPINADRVLALTAKGWSAARIAKALGCSDRAVHKIRAARSPGS